MRGTDAFSTYFVPKALEIRCKGAYTQFKLFFVVVVVLFFFFLQVFFYPILNYAVFFPLELYNISVLILIAPKKDRLLPLLYK